MQFSLHRKRQDHRLNRCSASVSVGLIFTRSYRSTLLIITLTTTPSQVKTSLKRIRFKFEEDFPAWADKSPPEKWSTGVILELWPSSYTLIEAEGWGEKEICTKGVNDSPLLLKSKDAQFNDKQSRSIARATITRLQRSLGRGMSTNTFHRILPIAIRRMTFI